MAEWLLIALGAVVRDGDVLITRRRAGVPQAGKWEFPGGKVAVGESLPDAVARELREEVGITVAVGEEVASTRYAYPDVRVELHLFRCELIAGEPMPLQVSEVRWSPVAELAIDDYPPANAPLLAALQRMAGKPQHRA